MPRSAPSEAACTYKTPGVSHSVRADSTQLCLAAAGISGPLPIELATPAASAPTRVRDGGSASLLPPRGSEATHAWAAKQLGTGSWELPRYNPLHPPSPNSNSSDAVMLELLCAEPSRAGTPREFWNAPGYLFATPRFEDVRIPTADVLESFAFAGGSHGQ